MIDGLQWRFYHYRRQLRTIKRWQKIFGGRIAASMAYHAFKQVVFPKPMAQPRAITLPGYRYPIHYRPGSSDLAVILQVLGDCEYQCVTGLEDVRAIIDCGANIGCTTFYVLHHYRDARVCVVEPDSENLAMCRRNLAPFADRVMFVEAGLWSSSEPMVVERGQYRDGAEWAFQVRPARSDETPDFQAITMAELIEQSGFESIDILKMDIEEAEAEVFATDTESWLSRVRHLVIEIHNSKCERVVLSALEDYDYTRSQSGEMSDFAGLQQRVLSQT